MSIDAKIWLIVDSKKYGGIEAHIFHLALLLKNQESGVCVVFVNDYGEHPLSSALEKSDVQVVKCTLGFLSLLKLAKKHRPKILHSHGYKAGLITRFIGQLFHIPVIHTHHAGEKHSGKLAVYMALDRWSAFLNRKNISVSECIQNSLPCDSQVVNNFVDLPCRPTKNGEQIAFVGRLSNEKGPVEFLNLARCFPVKYFHLYGDGPMSEELQCRASDNCIFHGYTDMEPCWDSVDVLIISSRYEGLPLAALEAMAHGVPVIAYPVGDLPCLITCGENGFLASTNTLMDLAGELKLWLSLDCKSKQSIRDKAKERIRCAYSTNVLAGEYRRIYSGVSSEIFEPKKAKRVLITHYGDEWMRGSEVCLLELCRKMDRNKWEPIVWTNVKCLEQELKALSVTTILDEFTILAGWNKPRWNFLRHIQLRHKAKKIIHSYHIDLVHCNNAAPNQWLVPVAKRLGVPVLCQLHSAYQFRDRMSLLINEVDALIGVSHAVLAPLRSDVFQCGLQKVIFNGIDLCVDSSPSSSLRAELNIPKASALLITVGSLIHRKGVDLILESMQYLSKQLHLVVVGKGGQASELHQLAVNIGVAQRVHWLGEREDVSSLLRGGANVFVSGAREEAFGLVLAEAGLAKVPVVAPRVGGIPEVLKAGECGVLVEPENSKSIALGIRRVLEHDPLVCDMPEKFYARIVSDFDGDKNAYRVMEVYDGLIERGDPKVYFFDIKAVVKIIVECFLKR